MQYDYGDRIRGPHTGPSDDITVMKADIAVMKPKITAMDADIEATKAE
jgi:hypothetical protein